MAATFARIRAQLSDPTESIPPELIDLINKNIRPPTPVSPEDVYVRAMFVVSDRVNSFGGRFPPDEHEHLASLLIDSPVMVGHRKDKLPLGRNFHAVTLMRGNENWVKSYFYWLKNSEGAANLRENIDGGIYKECSIGFTYHLPECSLCGKDIRLCEHEPLAEYRQRGTTVICHFNYRQIERVLETSLVYRGAVPDTSVSRELMPGVQSAPPLSQIQRDEKLTPVDDLSLFEPSGRYLVVPRYEGVPVLVAVRGGKVTLKRLDGSGIDPQVAQRYSGCRLGDSDEAYGLLVGYRGRERSSRNGVEEYLAGGDSSISRLVLTLYPPAEPDGSAAHAAREGRYVRMIPHRIASGDNLHQRALEIMTRDGVEIWPAGRSRIDAHGYLYRPSGVRPASEGCTFTLNDVNGRTQLAVQHKNLRACFEIVAFDRARLADGRRFVARKVERPLSAFSPGTAIIRTGRVLDANASRDGMLLNLQSNQGEKLVLKPVILSGQEQYLFFCRRIQ